MAHRIFHPTTMDHNDRFSYDGRCECEGRKRRKEPLRRQDVYVQQGRICMRPTERDVSPYPFT